ncbi:hypothetical protein E2C01_069661 [Portunus trituberculatus]|uniref:Secreted protein n=1 Tax=Portunus trituberculatus TaxID=210409 RepID=A0A5B7I000_PORTR|nr:hypothetical protein [Portunus trituberculatus]
MPFLWFRQAFPLLPLPPFLVCSLYPPSKRPPTLHSFTCSSEVTSTSLICPSRRFLPPFTLLSFAPTNLDCPTPPLRHLPEEVGGVNGNHY